MIITVMIIFINYDNIYRNINQPKEIIMFNCLLLFVKGLCCAVSANQQIQHAQSSRLCLPIKCAVEIKDCYDHCTAEVTPVNHEVEMAGAPSDHSMV